MSIKERIEEIEFLGKKYRYLIRTLSDGSHQVVRIDSDDKRRDEDPIKAIMRVIREILKFKEELECDIARAILGIKDPLNQVVETIEENYKEYFIKAFGTDNIYQVVRKIIKK